MTVEETLREENAQLKDELKAACKSLDALRDELQNGTKYRRLDCLRIAQKHAGDDGSPTDTVINWATLFWSFVETGAVPGPNDPPTQ